MRWTLYLSFFVFSFTFAHREDIVQKCSISSFTCKNGQCIDLHKICDNQKDCLDGSDEDNCQITTGVCPKDMFSCDDTGTNCISMLWVCDGHRDCINGKDEEKCHFQFKCPENYMKCQNKHCVSIKLKCNGVDDCGDGSDEEDCVQPSLTTRVQTTTSKPTIPSTSTIASTSTSTITTTSFRPRCPVSSFTCKNGQCADLGDICNGRADCTDGSDELNCSVGKTECPKGFFSCDEFGTDCIPMSWVCDGHKDCKNGVDEDKCHFATKCPENYINCQNKHCVASRLQCNGVDDCGDGSDEEHCNSPVLTTVMQSSTMSSTSFRRKCSVSKFTCNNGQCVEMFNMCDGHNDCSDGSDEINCSIARGCPKDFFSCDEYEIDCIPMSWVCDGHSDCPGGTDEQKCHFANKCPEGYFKCRNKHCILEKLQCNGVKDCGDGSDEENCPSGLLSVKLSSTVTPVKVSPTTVTPILRRQTCSMSSFTCNNGECIEWVKMCDGRFDCSDNSDEVNCKAKSSGHNECPKDYFKCDQLGYNCIPVWFVCDGYKDCKNGLDEEKCPFSRRCPANYIQCRNKHCVANKLHCNGIDDCGDGTDEEDCVSPILLPVGRPLTTTPTPQICPATSFKCNNGQCISFSIVCNGKADCSDSSDEIHCQTKAECMKKKDSFSCDDDGDNNIGDKCIHISWVCDGVKDCHDGKDEASCPVTQKVFEAVSSDGVRVFSNVLMALVVIIVLVSLGFATVYMIRRTGVTKHLFGYAWKPSIVFRRRLCSQQDHLVRNEEGVNPKLEKAESFSNPVYEGNVQIPFPNAYMAFKSKAVQKDSDTDSGLEFNISRSISAN